MNKSILKKGMIVSVMALTMVGSFFAGGLQPSVVAANTVEASTKGITVNGVGAVYAKPDMAVVSLGIETSNEDSQAAQTQNTTLTNEVIEALKDLGIEEDDIKTSSYNLYRERNYNTEDGVPVEGDYRVNHNLEVTVRKIDEAGLVIDTASKSGANQVNGVRFTVADTSKYYHEALKKAIVDAGGKANTIAGALSVTIGKPDKVVENSYNEPVVGAYMEAEMVSKLAGDRATPISTGELEIRAQVQVTYNY